ncbi:hypothetical protein SASPL_144383 [Salvia splendens]|uniref:Retrovirus-related Pol polyprotein from transposon TNT 1-94-like beta-barrel domain-containing protein n=1 Tax=Salvia splendens TaxID=180675 RepID=A0A8X8Z7A5_SALSN|nr:hypothetical protein SASPL_144383 [Salvia splendens]
MANGSSGYADLDEANRLRENKNKDSKALAIIQQAVHDSKEFKGDSKVIVVRLQSLRRDFETLIMKNGEYVADFLSRAMAAVSQMRSCGDKITDQTIVEKVLRSLTPKFDHVVAAMKNQRTYRISLQQEDEADEEKQAKCVQEETNDNKLFMAVADAVDVPNDVWFVDSGCSNHMCFNKEMFKELDESRKIQVRLGDDKSIQFEGKGTVGVKDGHVFDDSFCVIKEKKSGQIIAKVYMMENRMFPL